MTLIEAGTSLPDHSLHSTTAKRTEQAGHGRRWRRLPGSRALWAHVGLLALLTLLSIGMWWRVWISGDPSKTMLCGCGDPGLNLWFVRWAEWSVIHLHNPFLSNAVYAGQGGANTLDTDTLFTGIVGIPLTALFGPVFSFNLLSLLVPVANGWSLFFFLRRVTRFYPAQLLASALYGFSPYVVSNAMYGHFNIDLVVFPPLMLWCLHDLLIGRRHKPIRIGLTLGVLIALQFMAGPEELAMCAVLSVFGIAVLVVAARDLVRQRFRALVTAGVAASGVAVVLLAYPVWFLVGGPCHTSGYPWPRTPDGGIALPNIYNPGRYSAHERVTQIYGYYGPAGPTQAYLGYLLLGLLALAAVVWWRRKLARCAFLMAAVAVVLALGTGNGKPYPFWTPWRLVDHVPVLSEIMPGRFVLFVDLTVSLLLAIALDGALDIFRQRWRRPRLLGIGTVVLAAGTLIPIGLADTVPLTTHASTIPGWFNEVAPRLRPGTELLVLPDASSGNTDSMTWQALSDFDFKMVGGYALVPGPDGHTSTAIDPLKGATAILDKLSFGLVIPPDAIPALTSEVRASLQKWGVDDVVVTQQTSDGAYAAGFMTAVLGRAPLWQDGVWVWYGIGDQASFGLPPGVAGLCRLKGGSQPLAVPDCVLSARGS